VTTGSLIEQEKSGDTWGSTMPRIILLLFAGGLIVGSIYFLLLCVQYPTIYGMWRGGVPSLFWVGLGCFLIWDDFLRPRKMPPREKT